MAMTGSTMGMIGSSIGYADGKTAMEPRNPNFADSVNYADERVNQLVARLGELADRLCGSVPEAVGEGAPVRGNYGVFDAVMYRAGSITTLADTGLALIARIERALP